VNSPHTLSGGTILSDDAAAVVRDVRFIYRRSARVNPGQRACASTLARVVVRVVRAVRVVRVGVARAGTGLAATREREVAAAPRF
jgi:hypothetical protein